MRPVVLIVLDGWGHRTARDGNAVAQAATPVFDRLWDAYPRTLLTTSGLAVGLPDGVMGNSEVGHLNIGAGRVVFQDLTLISEAVRKGEFKANPVLRAACESVRCSGGALHCMGLLSDGGVHSHIDHLEALLELTKAAGVQRVAVHPFLDGRDTAPTGGIRYLRRLQTKCNALGNAAIATLCGRYYAMDRDKRWERTRLAYMAIVEGEGPQASDPLAALEASYGAGVTDEFVLPTVIARDGRAVAQMRDGDGVIFFNFRGDRARQISRAIAFPDFAEFQRQGVPKLATYTCFTEYDQTFPFPVAFPGEGLQHVFGEVVSQAGRKQLRIAETEKYAHVTFFFNGGEERLYPGEDRCLIPSPRDVPTYDCKPEMSAREVTAEVVRRINSDGYDAVILNFANADMVGHTG
ncbi:MAG: 2,3-bisphosphoglycerate-independent phosphoglycerate mutase, partial [Deltaproteobacteria bacterium]|nr:2,3-bisphosphoglycerate-independent phosphoglycerate mutase [Deltaproteobacteria bacterium]